MRGGGSFQGLAPKGGTPGVAPAPAVEVAEAGSAHGGRLALSAAGHGVAAEDEHGSSPYCGGHAPLKTVVNGRVPPWGFWAQIRQPIEVLRQPSRQVRAAQELSRRLARMREIEAERRWFVVSGQWTAIAGKRSVFSGKRTGRRRRACARRAKFRLVKWLYFHDRDLRELACNARRKIVRVK
jgi:hypothetical protein